MVAYSFKKQFVAPILAQTKDQTIRADRKRHARAGEVVQLYNAMRTRQCFLIGVGRALMVAPIRLDFLRDAITLAGKTWSDAQTLDKFSRLDGFDGWREMAAFWRENHPDAAIFSGVLIRWRDFTPAINTLIESAA